MDLLFILWLCSVLLRACWILLNHSLWCMMTCRRSTLWVIAIPSYMTIFSGYFISDLFNDLYCRTPNLMSSYAMRWSAVSGFCWLTVSSVHLTPIDQIFYKPHWAFNSVLFRVWCSVPGPFLVCVCQDLSWSVDCETTKVMLILAKFSLTLALFISLHIISWSSQFFY